MEKNQGKEGFVKFRFIGSAGSTAGLVMAESKFSNSTITDLSKHFPYFEATKMEKLEVSGVYPDFNSAFGHDFELGPNQLDI